MPPVSSLFCPFFLYLLPAGYIHSSSYSQSSYNWRCNASRSLRSLPLSFFSPSFSLPFPLSRDAGIPSLPRVEKRWSFLSLGWQNGPAASRSVTSGFPNRGPVWRVTSYLRPRRARERRRGRGKKREEPRRCNSRRQKVVLFDGDPLSYLRSKYVTRNMANNRVY